MKTDKQKEFNQTVISGILVFILFWVLTTNVIQSFKCPKMTNMEIFLNMPKSFVLDFEDCN